MRFLFAAAIVPGAVLFVVGLELWYRYQAAVHGPHYVRDRKQLGTRTTTKGEPEIKPIDLPTVKPLKAHRAEIKTEPKTDRFPRRLGAR